MIATVGAVLADESTAPGAAAAAPADYRTEQIWAQARLARADALLRRNRPRAAARLFMEVFERSPGTPWASVAEFGLAWSAIASGDLATARVLSRDAVREADVLGDAAEVLVALLNASEGDGQNAVGRLTRILDGPRAATPTRDAVRLARAYAYFWAGRYQDGISDFEAVAASDASGALADDASYGAAWSRVVAGDEVVGIAALHRIVNAAPAGTRRRPVPRALVELAPAAVLRESFRRYRKAGRQMPEVQLALLLDSDGVARAWAALRLLEPRQARPVRRAVGVAALAPSDGGVEGADGVEGRRRAPVAGASVLDAQAGPVRGPSDRRSSTTTPVAIVLLLAALLVGLATRRLAAAIRARGR